MFAFSQLHGNKKSWSKRHGHHPHAKLHDMCCCRLNEMQDGSKAQVKAVLADSAECNRLYALGIIPGAEIEMQSGGSGNSVVRVHDCSLVLGDELASKIECIPSFIAVRARRAHAAAIVLLAGAVTAVLVHLILARG